MNVATVQKLFREVSPRLLGFKFVESARQSTGPN